MESGNGIFQSKKPSALGALRPIFSIFFGVITPNLFQLQEVSHFEDENCRPGSFVIV